VNPLDRAFAFGTSSTTAVELPGRKRCAKYFFHFFFGQRSTNEQFLTRTRAQSNRFPPVANGDGYTNCGLASCVSDGPYHPGDNRTYIYVVLQKPFEDRPQTIDDTMLNLQFALRSSEPHKFPSQSAIIFNHALDSALPIFRGLAKTSNAKNILPFPC
jgi:hypothetical protein